MYTGYGRSEFDGKISPEIAVRTAYSNLAKAPRHYKELNMEDKITIIEGPPPTFEAVPEGWVQGLSDSPLLSGIVSTRLRTFNGPSLVERCHRAWRNQLPIHLEYRNTDGLQEEAQIVAARNVETDEGDMLVLWVRIPNDDIELEIGYEDELDDEDDFEDDYDEEEDDYDDDFDDEFDAGISPF
jgi:hypothetical protein